MPEVKDLVEEILDTVSAILAWKRSLYHREEEKSRYQDLIAHLDEHSAYEQKELEACEQKLKYLILEAVDAYAREQGQAGSQEAADKI